MTWIYSRRRILSTKARRVAQVAEELGCSIERIQTSPDFRRHLLLRGAESVVVDLVRERVAQIVSEKPIVDGIRVDPPEEIFANKLCALLSRSELRDLVDVRALEGAGFALEPALAGGARKDGGLTAAQLAWVLSQVSIGDDASPPGGLAPTELRDYLKDLISRLVRLGLPQGPGA